MNGVKILSESRTCSSALGSDLLIVKPRNSARRKFLLLTRSSMNLQVSFPT